MCKMSSLTHGGLEARGGLLGFSFHVVFLHLLPSPSCLAVGCSRGMKAEASSLLESQALELSVSPNTFDLEQIQGEKEKTPPLSGRSCNM